jgi:2-methylcitrate dehydratase PrpD
LGATQTLARKILETTWETLPAEVRDEAKLLLLDGLGNMIAGSQFPVGQGIQEYVLALGGAPQATVVGSGHKTNVLNAAFANGTFNHSLEFEPLSGHHHPTSPVLAAILAIAELREFPGTDVVTALVVAIETEGRIHEGIDPERVMTTIHPLGAVGAIGSAAGCLKLLQLDERRARNAIGMASSRASGLMANSGSMTKPTHAGNGARMGLEAALLAEVGWTADQNALEAWQGYYEVFYHHQPEGQFENFGRPFRIVDPGLWIKMYPANGTTHWGIDAALNLYRAHAPEAAKIESIEVELPQGCEAAERASSPWPIDGLDGKFSVPYTVAVALLDGKVVLDSFTDERRFSEDVERLMRQTKLTINKDSYFMDFDTAWCRVSLTTTDGQTWSERVDRPTGYYGNRPSAERRLQKFRDCASRLLSDEDVARIIESVENIDSLPSVTQLASLLRGDALATPTVKGKQ